MVGKLHRVFRLAGRGNVVVAFVLLALVHNAVSACMVHFSDGSGTDQDSGADGTVDSSGFCGDGIKDPGEQCDGNDFGGATCKALGLDVGTLSCTSRCFIDTKGCGGCGNGVIDTSDEECDGDDLQGKNCEYMGFPEGELSCSQDCKFDVSTCRGCGNGVVEPELGEMCDGGDLGGMTCQSLGYDEGQVHCRPDCTVDDSGCTNLQCGNGVAEAFEACDGQDVRSLDCSAMGYQSGFVACSSDCRIDARGCAGGDDSCDQSSGDCSVCQGCAAEQICGDAWNACSTDPDCASLVQCMQSCGSDMACVNQCALDNQGGVGLYHAVAYCVLCNACPSQCGTAEYCH